MRILLTLLLSAIVSLGAVTYPPAPISGTGPVIGSNSGKGTNTTLTTPTLNGPIVISSSSFGAPGQFTLGGQSGPSIFNYQNFNGSNLTLLAGDGGIVFAPKQYNTYWMTLGYDWVYGFGAEKVLRMYDSQDRTVGVGGDVRYGFPGTTVSSYFPMVGGNAAMMQGTPVHGGELAQRIPVILDYITTGGGVGGPRPGTNNCTTFYITNQIGKCLSSGYFAMVRAAGGQLKIGLEPGHLCEFRNPDGSLRWNTNAIPEGPVWLADYCHTNGFLIGAHLYYNPSWSNNTSGLVINDGGGYLTPVATADRVTRDIGTYSDWQFDGILAADMSTFVDVESVGYRHAIARQVADEVLNPRGRTPRNQAIPGRQMHLEEFLDMRGFPMASSAYETSGSHVGDSMGLTISLTSPLGTAGMAQMQQLRQSWTNYMWMAGKGHYFGVCVLDPRTWQTNSNYKETAANGMFNMGANIMSPLYAFLADAFDTAAIWTNAATQSVMTNLAAQKLRFDSGYNPGFPVYDFGPSNVSCWVKPLAGGNDYALMLANELGASSNMVFNWTTNVVSPATFHAVNCPLYPVLIPTNAWYAIDDIQNGTNCGTVASSFTATVTNHSCRVFKLTRMSPPPVPNTTNVVAYFSGTAYTLTAVATALTFGTAQPVITIPQSGTYMIFANTGIKYSGSTYAGAQTITLKLRRASPSPADLSFGSRTVELPVLTTFTGGDVMALPPVVYSGSAGDTVTIFGSVSATPSAGSVQADSAEVVAIRLY